MIGSNNSAFDICGALHEVGADVTMVQRSSTHIVRSESAMQFAFKALYSEEAVASGISTERADLIAASLPYRIMPQVQIPIYERIREHDAEYYARLERAGFELDFGEDGSGMSMKYLRRGSGYYIDVGAAELVAGGQVELARGQVDHLTRDAVVLADGTKLAADLVVYATGYGSMNGWAAELISPEVADRVGKVWGLGSDTTRDPGPWEGEERNMWKPTRQPGLWFHGGNLAQSRFYSLYLALQLKARAVGIATPVYGLPGGAPSPLSRRCARTASERHDQGPAVSLRGRDDGSVRRLVVGRFRARTRGARVQHAVRPRPFRRGLRPDHGDGHGGRGDDLTACRLGRVRRRLPSPRGARARAGLDRSAVRRASRGRSRRRLSGQRLRADPGSRWIRPGCGWIG